MASADGGWRGEFFVPGTFTPILLSHDSVCFFSPLPTPTCLSKQRMPLLSRRRCKSVVRRAEQPSKPVSPRALADDFGGKVQDEVG